MSEYAKKITITDADLQVDPNHHLYRIQCDEKTGFTTDDYRIGAFLFECWARGSEIVFNASEKISYTNTVYEFLPGRVYNDDHHPDHRGA